MFDDFDDPGPCPVCGTAHSACPGDHDSAGIGTTRGVILIRQLPARDASLSTSGSDSSLGDEPAPAAAPAAPVHKRGARPIKRPGQTARK